MDAGPSTRRTSLKRKAATVAQEKMQAKEENETDASSSSSSDEMEDEDEPEASDLDELTAGGAHEVPMVDVVAAGDKGKDKEEVEDEQPVKKKAKKAVKAKVAVWDDLKGWKEGDDPLGRFPVEVLDLIINIDADLDLRDHLALAATCRYFRSCYSNVVFQVLFESKYPDVNLPVDRIIIMDDGEARDSSYNPNALYKYMTPAPSAYGPFHQSYNHARWIFSTSRASGDGWGVPNDEWAGSDAQQAEEKQTAEFSAYLAAGREKRRPDFQKLVKEKDDSAMAMWRDATDAYNSDLEDWNRTQHARGLMLVLPHSWDVYGQPGPKPVSEGTVGVWRMMEELLAHDVAVYGESIRPKGTYAPKVPQWQKKHSTATPSYLHRARDPWTSPWRTHVADIVNKPRISKSAAKATYKVSDAELAALKMTKHNHWSRKGAAKWYYLAAVQALSLRSHGGVNGHKAVIKKSEDRKEKNKEARIKNGTFKLPKPKVKKPRSYGGLWGYYDEYDGYDGYDIDDY